MTKSPNELKPETLINRVMSGKKEYRTPDYLQAFAKISCSDLHHSNYSYFEVVKLWNSLQSVPKKQRYFTTVEFKNYSHIIANLKKYVPKWAYICHDKDKTAERKHYHFYLEYPNEVSFRSVAEDLEIPVTMLEKVRFRKFFLDYLTHENDPNKHHYSIDEIQSNFDIVQAKEEDQPVTVERVKEEFRMYCAMVDGEISKEQFFDYMSRYIVRHSASQRISVYHSIKFDSRPFMDLTKRSAVNCHTPVNTVFPFARKSSIPQIIDGKRVDLDIPPAPKQSYRSYRKANARSDLNDVE
nr:MAG: plasmid replication protein [uncultured bacterium]